MTTIPHVTQDDPCQPQGAPDGLTVTRTPAVPHGPGARILAAGRIGPARYHRSADDWRTREGSTDYLTASGRVAHGTSALRYPRAALTDTQQAERRAALDGL